MYLAFFPNVEKTVLKYCSREVLDVIPFSSELKRDRRRRVEEVEEIGAGREDETVFVTSISFLECEIYTLYIPSVRSVDQYLQESCYMKGVDYDIVLYYKQVSNVPGLRNYSE